MAIPVLNSRAARTSRAVAFSRLFGSLRLAIAHNALGELWAG